MNALQASTTQGTGRVRICRLAAALGLPTCNGHWRRWVSRTEVDAILYTTSAR